MGRSSIGVVLAVFCAACAACGGKDRPELPRDPLVLDLGSGDVPLGQLLHPGRATQQAVPAPTPRPDPAARQPAPSPPRPEPEAREVRLGPGETIVDLCDRWLGDANRWPEVVELNGWTELQTRRLRPGTVVVLPTR